MGSGGLSLLPHAPSVPGSTWEVRRTPQRSPTPAALMPSEPSAMNAVLRAAAMGCLHHSPRPLQIRITGAPPPPPPHTHRALFVRN